MHRLLARQTLQGWGRPQAPAPAAGRAAAEQAVRLEMDALMRSR
jgi:hypothetical protein